MRIYVSHPTAFDYQAELYTPLTSGLSEHELVLPHEKNDHATDTKDIIQNSDIILAEVSHPSTGQGIELGWANDANVLIICIHRNDAKPSGALQIVTNKFINYSSTDELVQKLTEVL